jgi:Flp pilus assembly protein CpaB
MQKSTIIILTSGLLLAAGVAAYELAAPKPALSPSPQTVYPMQAEAPATPVLPNSSSLPSGQPTQQPMQPMSSLNSQPSYPAPGPTASQTTLRAETPTTAVVPPLPGNSYVEQSQTTTTTVTPAPAPHRVYVRRHVVYHRHNDKVHIGRAVKHTTMFALKLPGRAAI